MRAPAQRPGDSAGCSGGSGSNSYTGSYAGSYAGSWHQDRTDLRASAAVHHRPVSSRAGQAPSGGQLIPEPLMREFRLEAVKRQERPKSYSGAAVIAAIWVLVVGWF